MEVKLSVEEFTPPLVSEAMKSKTLVITAFTLNETFCNPTPSVNWCGGCVKRVSMTIAYDSES